MPHYREPEIGAWYKDRVDRRTFEVVAVDEHEGTVDLQYFEGEVTEVDFDTWKELKAFPIAQPYEVEEEEEGLENSPLCLSNKISEW